MIKLYSVPMVLALALPHFSVAHSHEEKTMGTEETNVLQTVNAMTSAFQKKEIEDVMATYESGAAVMFEPGQKISDPAMLRQLFEGAFQLNPEFDYPQGHEVYISHDIALHIAPWIMTAKTPDGKSIQQSGLSVAVLRKQADGRWLLVLDNPHGQHLMEQ